MGSAVFQLDMYGVGEVPLSNESSSCLSGRAFVEKNSNWILTVRHLLKIMVCMTSFQHIVDGTVNATSAQLQFLGWLLFHEGRIAMSSRETGLQM
jgi:hypothetical protein